jgi:hypothetical protein
MIATVSRIANRSEVARVLITRAFPSTDRAKLPRTRLPEGQGLHFYE